MVAEIKIAGHWVRYNISFQAAQLARFCVLAGLLHWATLTQLIGYLIHLASLKLKYLPEMLEGLDCFRTSRELTRQVKPLASPDKPELLSQQLAEG
jgi:hypothetical protein